jgi:transcriptional regulator with XRE-family HTH domain
MGRLKELRRRQLLTQRELGERVGVSFQTVQSWESGKSQPRLRHIGRLAEVLGVSADELLEEFDAGKAAA